jgi:hypothetical protein
MYVGSMRDQLSMWDYPMRVRLSRGRPWWLYICSQLGFTSISCLLLQVEVLGLAGFVYPLSGLLSWQEPGRPISRTEGSYPRHLVYHYLWFPFNYCKSISYKGKLMSIIICALVNVMLLVRILIIDTSLHKPVVMFTEFSFRLGTSEV